MKYLIVLYFSVLMFSSCASNEENDKEKYDEKRFSDDTNRAFEMIERGGSYYLKMAPTSSTPAPQIRPSSSRHTRVVETLRPGQQQGVKEEVNIDENITAQKREKPKPHLPVKSKNAKVDERLIEINQNLAFYCMKHRKDSAFKDDESKCMTFVNQSMEECQKIHHSINSKLLNCIQAKLKKRR